MSLRARGAAECVRYVIEFRLWFERMVRERWRARRVCVKNVVFFDVGFCLSYCRRSDNCSFVSLRTSVSFMLIIPPLCLRKFESGGGNGGRVPCCTHRSKRIVTREG